MNAVNLWGLRRPIAVEPAPFDPSSADDERWPRVAPLDEPGETVRFLGRIRDVVGSPIAGVSVHVFHADDNGVYNPHVEGDADPRLQRTFTTDADGLLRFETIRPGAYNGGPPHIHFIITPPDAERLLAAVNFHGAEFDTFGPVEAFPADASPRRALGESEGRPLCHWKMTLPV